MEREISAWQRPSTIVAPPAHHALPYERDDGDIATRRKLDRLSWDESMVRWGQFGKHPLFKLMYTRSTAFCDGKGGDLPAFPWVARGIDLEVGIRA